MHRLLDPAVLVPLTVLLGFAALAWLCRKDPRYCRGCDQPVSSCRCDDCEPEFID